MVSEEEFSRHVPPYPQRPGREGEACCPVFAYTQEFWFQPPPLYSEVKQPKENETLLCRSSAVLG